MGVAALGAGAALLATGAADTAGLSSGGGAGLLQALNVEASRMTNAGILWEIIIGDLVCEGLDAGQDPAPSIAELFRRCFGYLN